MWEPQPLSGPPRPVQGITLPFKLLNMRLDTIVWKRLGETHNGSLTAGSLQ
jgi:hypothetical protein